MYHCGDQVVYGVHGICGIIALENRVMNRKRVEYYVLEPLDQPGTRFYVPTQNQAALAKLRSVLTREQIDMLLKSKEVRADVWIPDENLRKQRYRELIHGSDLVSLVAMVGSLHRHKSQMAAAGRKFHICDDNFLRDAEKLLSTEFAVALGIAPDEVADYVQRLVCE